MKYFRNRIKINKLEKNNGERIMLRKRLIGVTLILSLKRSWTSKVIAK